MFVGLKLDGRIVVNSFFYSNIISKY